MQKRAKSKLAGCCKYSISAYLSPKCKLSSVNLRALSSDATSLQIQTPAEHHQIAMAPITGTYTQVSSEKYEEFLKALGVGFILRKAALASTPVMTISEEGGNWTMVTKTTVKSIELKFRSVKGQNLLKSG